MASAGTPGGLHTGMELLTIHPSASKPSLISSFWSIHVQIPNMEASDLDLRCASQNSLPDVAMQQEEAEEETKGGTMNRSKSLSDLRSSVIDPRLFHRETADPPSARSSQQHEDSAERQRRISFSVQEWLRRVEPSPISTA